MRFKEVKEAVNISRSPPHCRAVAFNFGEGFGTALANGRAGFSPTRLTNSSSSARISRRRRVRSLSSGRQRFGWNGCSDGGWVDHDLAKR